MGKSIKIVKSVSDGKVQLWRGIQKVEVCVS